jgi:hypothetical protein
MARQKRTSAVLEMARQRMAGLKSINPAPDLGPNLTVAMIETQTNGFGTQMDTYNQHVATLDDEQNGVNTAEDSLEDLMSRVLSAVRAQFGADSSEYEAVGGTRTSERRRRTARPVNPKPEPATT